MKPLIVPDVFSNSRYEPDSIIIGTNLVKFAVQLVTWKSPTSPFGWTEPEPVTVQSEVALKLSLV